MIIILTEKFHGGFLMDLKSKQNWLNFLDLWSKSGQTKAEFCKSKKITASKFYYYAKRHRVLPSKPTIAAHSTHKQSLFIPVTSKKEFKIKINESVSLTFEAAPDALWMASFIKSFGDHHATV
jgi:hypothetical protein